jgi:hypothetical protein
MLIRLVCAVKDKKLHADLEKRLSIFDVQLKMIGTQKRPGRIWSAAVPISLWSANR